MTRTTGGRLLLLAACISLAGIPDLGAVRASAGTPGSDVGRDAPAAPGGDQARGRLWRVENSIPIRYFYNSSDTSWWGDGRLAYSVAPDGNHFFVMSARGDLACDCQHFELAIYSTIAVQRALARPGRASRALVGPVRVVRMHSADGRDRDANVASRSTNPLDAIEWPQWQDSATLLFRGTGEGEADHGLYSYDLAAGRLTRLSAPGRHVGAFDVRGGRAVYNAFEIRTTARDANGYPAREPNYPVLAIGGTDFQHLLNASSDNRIGYFLGGPDGSDRELVPFRPVEQTEAPFAPLISPDGAFAVIPVRVDRAGFDRLAPRDPGLADAVYNDLMASERRRLWQVGVVDMASGRVTVPVDRLLGPQPPRPPALASVFWLAGGRQLVMVNVLPPAPAGQEDLRRSGAVLGYDVRSGTIATIVGPSADGSVLAGARAIEGGEAILLDFRKPDGTRASTRLSWGPEGFRQSPAAAAATTPATTAETALRGFQLALSEGPNRPPVIVARSGAGEVALTAPDPAVQDLSMAEERVFEWRDAHGHRVAGRLVLPARRPASGRYPLVLQFEGIDYGMDLFRPDGMASIGSAAQALAARGIAVLRLNSSPHGDHPEVARDLRRLEGPVMVDRVESAIRALEAQGLVDPTRIGMIGFSRTGYHVHYFVTHSRFVPAAAIVQDATSQGYFEHVMGAAASDGEGLGARAGDFWASRDLWLQQAPGFNYDAVDTPTLFSYNSLYYALRQAAEPMAGYRYNDREAYFQIYPEAGHQMQRPRQRLAAMQTTVDWFSFWLLGEENGDPTSVQSRRWRHLRANRDERWNAARAAGRPFGSGWRALATQAVQAASLQRHLRDE